MPHIGVAGTEVEQEMEQVVVSLETLQQRITQILHEQQPP